MLHILLLILKIIGFILLVVLGMIVFAFGMLLFVPAVYRMDGKANGDIKSLSVCLKVSWLFHALTFVSEYGEQKWNVTVRVLGIKLKRKPKDKDQKRTQEKKESKRESEKESEKEKTFHQECKTEKSNESKKTSLLQKIRCTIRKICDKIKALWEMKGKWKEFLAEEIHLAAFQKLKREVFVFAKHIRPRKWRGYVKYGLEDPYHTGQVLAILSVLFPFYGKNIEIYPQFDQKLLEGDLYVRGHIRGVHLLRLIWHWYFDRDIKQTYENLKNMKS